MKTRIGIFGYGNLGRGVENAICQNEDMELAAVFTRRAPDQLKIATEGVAVCSASDVDEIICNAPLPAGIIESQRHRSTSPIE